MTSTGYSSDYSPYDDDRLPERHTQADWDIILRNRAAARRALARLDAQRAQ